MSARRVVVCEGIFMAVELVWVDWLAIGVVWQKRRGSQSWGLFGCGGLV